MLAIIIECLSKYTIQYKDKIKIESITLMKLFLEALIEIYKESRTIVITR